MKINVSSTIITITMLVGMFTFLYSCGSEESVPTDTMTIIEYQEGDLIGDTTYLPPLHESFRETGGAVTQAIFAINTFLFTDNSVTSLATFEERKAQADQALDILIELASKTEVYADMIPEEQAALPSVRLAVATPEEVEAILASSKIKWPIKTLMQHYQVSAQTAKTILDDAMAGLISSYTDEAEFYTKSILAAQVVRDTSALTVAIGSSIITAGGVNGAMGLVEAGAAVISIADASIKTGVSGAEFIIGKDGSLTDAYNSSAIATGLSDLNEIVSIKSYFSAPSNLLDVASNYVYISGKYSDVLQEKKIAFGSHTFELTPVDVPKVALELSVSTEAVFPGSYVIDGSNLIVDYLPAIFTSLLANLPEESQVDDTKKTLAPTMTLSAVITSRTETSISYLVTATLTEVSGSVDVTLSIGSSSDTKTLTSDGSVAWNVTVYANDAIVSVTRSDNSETQTIQLNGDGHIYTYDELLIWNNYPDPQWCTMTSDLSSYIIALGNLSVSCWYYSADILPHVLLTETPRLRLETAGYVKTYNGLGELTACEIWQDGAFVRDCD